MRIFIKDADVCDSCMRKTCSVTDSIEKIIFAKLKSERYTCPLRILQNGPSDSQFKDGYIDGTSSGNEPACICCLLCVLKCQFNNLIIENYDSSDEDKFKKYVLDAEKNNPKVGKILASLYLDHLFGFSANTNLNSSLAFDGFVCDKDDGWYFVEVDTDNDSLESCRRLLGDIVVQNHSNGRNVVSGIMVLNELPKEGSRDVFALVESVRQFPKTTHLRIYATTFVILRYLCKKGYRHKTVSELLFNMTTETIKQYVERLVSDGTVCQNETDQLFGISFDNSTQRCIIENSAINFLTQNISCPYCNRSYNVNLGDYIVNDIYEKRPMGNSHLFVIREDHYECPICHKQYKIDGCLSEYPADSGSIEGNPEINVEKL